MYAFKWYLMKKTQDAPLATAVTDNTTAASYVANTDTRYGIPPCVNQSFIYKYMGPNWKIKGEGIEMLKGSLFNTAGEYHFADYPSMASMEFKFNINKDVKILSNNLV